ncbi:MAG: hypothetical protein H7Y02_08615 [Candidatus Obscuribacterales bacterium]|nr:hypothetical protein [Steroidobacteraceae bacterium]
MNKDPNSTSDESTDAFEARTRAVLRDSAEHLDAATRSRLTQARYAALAAVERGNSVRRSQWLMPAGVAAAAVFALILATGPLRSDRDQSDPMLAAQPAEADLDDLELIASEDSLELYREIEFYAWLDSALNEEAAPDARAQTAGEAS